MTMSHVLLGLLLNQNTGTYIRMYTSAVANHSF